MNFKSNEVAKTIIAAICFCRHGILDDVKSVSVSTVAPLFSGLQEGVSKDRIELFGSYRYREVFSCGRRLIWKGI